MAGLRGGRSYLAALGLFAAGWAILAFPWLSGAVTIPWDAKAEFYPQLQFLAQSLHRGEVPFWAPFVFAGVPQIADPQSLIFSPPHLLLAALTPDPSFRAADTVPLVMLGLGGAAVIAFFRDRGWRAEGALVAAFAFAFGAAAAWRLQHIGQILSLAWLAVAFWLLGRALDRGSPAAGLAAGLATAAMALGRDQVAYLGLWLLAGTVLARILAAAAPWTALKRSLAPLAIAGAAAAAAVALPLAMTLSLAEMSNRPAIDYLGAGRGSLHPALLLTAFVPDLFGTAGRLQDHWGPPSPLWGAADLFLARNMGELYAGAVPIAAIATAALVRGGLWSREIRFLTIALAVALAYALGRYTPLFRLLFEAVPGIDLFRRPADAVFLVGFIAALVAGYLVHRWCAGPAEVGLGPRHAAAAFIVAPVGACILLPYLKGTERLASWALTTGALWLALALSILAVLPRLSARSPRAALVLLATVMTADLAANNGPNESTALPPDTYAMLRQESDDPLVAALRLRLAGPAAPDPLARIELTGLGFAWPNASLVHRFHNVLGYNPLRLRLYSEATGAGDHVALPEQRRFSPLFPSYRSTLADLLGLRFIATGVPVERIDPGLASGDLVPLGRFGDGYLYENPRARPRVSFATAARAADFAAMLRDGIWPDVDLGTTVLLSRAPAGRAGPVIAEPAPRVQVVTYRNDEVVVAVDTPQQGYIVLNDPWHPWWFADIDRRPVPILRANVLFRAVAVPAGSHVVRFSFRPLDGVWASLTGRLRR